MKEPGPCNNETTTEGIVGSGSANPTTASEVAMDMEGHSHGNRKNAMKFHNEDLPGYPQTLKAFCDLVLLHWYLYISTLDNPWDLVHLVHIQLAQQLWYKYVRLKQRVCEWRKDIAKKALLAVKHFFDSYESTTEARAEYVSWAVPTSKLTLDKKGRKIIIPPAVYPYMWREVIENESGSMTTRSAFCHPCILQTFAHVLETMRKVPAETQTHRNPVAGLSLSTIAVERAFKYWKTGDFVVPSQKSTGKFSKQAWRFPFNEVLKATNHLTEKQWKKIRELAEEQLEGLIEQTKELLCEKSGIITGRAFCFENDSD
ncbi:hypothetical protein J3R82DRAFT_9425 [Butyriboletus roseoflavus]|nr:hypothetical protein J3R82DRAFT_9425 [Butyriboletus roseoflavus]